MATRKKAAAKKAAKTELVAGVRLNKASGAQLDESLKHLELPAGGEVADKIRRLANFFSRKQKELEAAEFDVCDACGGVCLLEVSAPLLGEVCPYCGDGPAVEEEAEEAAPPRGGAVVVAPVSHVIDDGAALVDGTEKDLDKAIQQVEKLKINLAKGFWEIGRVVADIHTRKLWQYRLSDADQPIYTSFESFVRAELKMSDDQAYRHLHVYRAFTADDVRTIGVSKLKAVLTVPTGPLRDKLLLQARGGASKRQLEKAAKKASKPEQDSGPEKVTVVLALASLRLPMFKRRPPNSKKEPEPAKSAKDDAFCEEDLPNGVRQTYRLVQKRTGQLELVIERKRV